MPIIQKPRLWTYSPPVALMLLAPFNIFPSLGMDIYLPVVPMMPTILQTSPAVVQLTLTVYMVMLGVGQIVFGPLSDRIGRRSVLVGGAVLFALASFALAATSQAYVFIALRLVHAIGASAMLVALFATVRDVYAERPESVVIYSLMSAMLAFVPALGPIAGALIADAWGWRAIFVALGIPTVAMLFLVLPKWHETRLVQETPRAAAFRPVLESLTFWTYTIAFGTAMGTFFVFFSTAPRVLIDGAGFSELGFSVAFATVALVMIVTTRFAKRFVERWGSAGSVARGMAMLVMGAGLLALNQLFLPPSFWSFVLPMWLMAIGIVFTTSVTANGALREFGDIAGTAVALHFCIQSIIVGVFGTCFVILLGGGTAWPLVAYSAGMAGVTLGALRRLHIRNAHPQPA
ncbi:CmlA/FloR family chloramphenicol efflux MFS transporter [Phyllobacterium salinisoli]|uniref:Bcr/CflA family efflux transporter n=1 Tax=Phyllobacterium salinisoli TaxID=1899321 RepID=A0A368K4I8_9HYPH|nr:CmlA/FloR family chloramphenicol efflux MFS transporter [Phyllobacterium salinisoli]RCS24141.1 CmlA/FloR family chloramphenicol efflux MFS transporter [Phyllobacterium salinisoli]